MHIDTSTYTHFIHTCMTHILTCIYKHIQGKLINILTYEYIHLHIELHAHAHALMRNMKLSRPIVNIQRKLKTNITNCYNGLGSTP